MRATRSLEPYTGSRWLWVLVLLAAVLAWPVAAQTGGTAVTRPAGAERKVALVMGNAAYRIGPLKNPSNDARDMAEALRRLGFEVIERHNATREQMAFAVREYGDRLRGASVGLFYFAGHGLQVRGRNFLVPVDADIAREDEVPYRGFDVNEALDKMDSARTAVNIVILDACRNNPFARSFRVSQNGLAQMDAPPGTLIAFATAPGSVAQDGEGRNGLYTAALLRHIASPGLAVEQMFKRVRVDVTQQSRQQQVPWESSSLNRDFAFASPAAAAAAGAGPATPAAATAAAAAATDAAIDLAFWESVRNSTRREDFQAYLDQFPAGRFAALARLRLGQGAAPAGAGAAAASPGVAAVAPGSSAAASAPAASASLAAAVTLPRGSPVRPDDTGRLSFAAWVGGGMRNIDLGTRAPVQALAASSDGTLLAAVSAGRLFLIETRQGAVLAQHPLGDASPAGGSWRDAQFSPDGRWLMLMHDSAAGPMAQVLDVGNGQVAWRVAALGGSFDGGAPSVRLRLPDGREETRRLP